MRVAEEALSGVGKVVAQQWLANTTAPGVGPRDRRRLDLVVYGASARGDALCCDATLVSLLRRDGRATARAADIDGAALERARRRKARVYPELGRHGTQLVVLGCKVGGRWDDQAVAFVRRLARLRSRQAPPLLRAAARAAYSRRWWGLLSVAVQDAVAATLLGAPLGPYGGCAAGVSPALPDVLTLCSGGSAHSRLPLRG